VLLSAVSLTKTFDGVQALGGLSFELLAGEVHALVGENGAGKTTFVRIVTGAERADGGSLAIDGADVAFATPAEARARGIAAIHQQPALFPDLSVAENIALSVERGAPWSRVSWRRRDRDSRALLERLGASIDPSRLVDTLTLPEQQLVEIAKVVGAEARIVLMDEPTSALTGREVDRLFAVIDRLRAAGAGIIYISHRLEEIRRIADRVTVIRDGRTAASGLDAVTPDDEIIRLMVGRAVEAVPAGPAGLDGGRLADVALEVRGLSARASGLADISFSVRRGEVLGVAGLVGSGRTELAEIVFGLRPSDGGEVWIRGARTRIRSPGEAIQAGLAYVPEDRRRHGVIADFDVAANTSLASLDRLAPAGFIRRGAERELAERYVRRFNIRTPSVGSAVGHLSGGNQQKVALARWLATSPSVLMLDEPTQGVDVGAKAEIHGLIRDLAAEGLAVVMISSDLSEVLRLSDRVLVMRRGRVSGILGRDDATTATVMTLAVGPAPKEPALGNAQP
jgi:rhamnose transport system ATP-binding protein